MPPLASNQGDSSSDSDDESVPSGDNGDDDSSSSPGAATAKAEACVLKAIGLKDAGNAFLKAGTPSDLDKAVRSYRRGASSLKGLNENNAGDDQVKALLISLSNNMAMVLGKQCKWRECVKVSKQALSVDCDNLKARYRLGLAYSSLGRVEDATAMFKRGLELDPDSRECKVQLARMKKVVGDAKKKEKAAFGGFLGSKNLGSLYEDREEEAKVRKIKAAEDFRKDKVRKEEEAKRTKQEWEDECVSRMARSEPPISEEEWKKEKEEEKKKKDEEEKKKKKEEERAKSSARKEKKKHEVVTVDGDSSDDDIGEIRGYKTNKFGQKTSFFNNDLTDETKALIGDIAPKAISVPSAPGGPGGGGSGGGSAWNKAGTWEERDTSEWCREELKKVLGGIEK